MSTTEKHIATRIGFVESDKRSKSRKVVVSYLDPHPKYGKYLRKRTVLQVHDENNESKLGDRVEVAPCKRVSKTKAWRLVRIVESAPEPLAAVETTAQALVGEDAGEGAQG